MRLILLLTLLISPVLVNAEVDPDRLWLPKSYASHWAALRTVADQAASSETCKKVLKGELARGKSTADHPVFGITCLGGDNRSFVVLYDGLSQKALVPMDEAEEAASNDEVLSVRESYLYAHCLATWEVELAMMSNLSWLDSIEDTRANRVESEEVDGREITRFYFERNFDATDVAGAPLAYTALCEGESSSSAQIRIAPRKN